MTLAYFMTLLTMIMFPPKSANSQDVYTVCTIISEYFDYI